jgi:hypothetical protein
MYSRCYRKSTALKGGVLNSTANKTKEREAYLERFLDEIEVLKLEIRLCKDLQK